MEDVIILFLMLIALKNPFSLRYSQGSHLTNNNLLLFTVVFIELLLHNFHINI